MWMCARLWKKERQKKKRKGIKPERERRRDRQSEKGEREKPLTPVTERILSPTTSNMTHILTDHKTFEYNPLWTHKQIQICTHTLSLETKVTRGNSVFCQFLLLGFGLRLFILFFQWSHWRRPGRKWRVDGEHEDRRSVVRTLIVYTVWNELFSMWTQAFVRKKQTV